MKKKTNSSSVSRKDEVISTLREMIGTGRLRAGQILTEQQLCDQLFSFNKLNVSRNPVRDAISHFVSHGVMEVHPKTHTKIREFTAAELREIWLHRLTLELGFLKAIAEQRDPDLTKLIASHRKLKAIVDETPDQVGVPTDARRRAFIDADELFHEELCVAAGCPLAKEELWMLRLKLRLASSAARLVESKERMEAIFQEHNAIVVALRGGANFSIRPDNNLVQHAFLVHMRNAARDSWRIEGIDTFIQRYAFDVPDLPHADVRNSLDHIPLSYPFLMRYCTEMSAVWNLAMRSERSIGTIDSTHNDMRDLIDRANGEDTVSFEIEREFINHDIDLHSGICVLGGLLFGPDIVTSVWRKLHDLHKRPLTIGHMKVVVEQHETILHGIRRSRGRKQDAQEACDAMAVHLTSAFIGHNLDKTERQHTVDMLRVLALKLEETWEKTN